MRNRTLRRAILLLTLILLASCLTMVLSACGNEPTESVTLTYEESADGITITGYEGVLASGAELKIPLR